MVPYSFSPRRTFLTIMDLKKMAFVLFMGLWGEFACSVLSLPSWFSHWLCYICSEINLRRRRKKLNLAKKKKKSVKWPKKLFLFWRVDATTNEDWQFKCVKIKASVNTSSETYLHELGKAYICDVAGFSFFLLLGWMKKMRVLKSMPTLREWSA